MIPLRQHNGIKIQVGGGCEKSELRTLSSSVRSAIDDGDTQSTFASVFLDTTVY
jgi:hypothetical protein